MSLKERNRFTREHAKDRIYTAKLGWAVHKQLSTEYLNALRAYVAEWLEDIDTELYLWDQP